MFNTLPFNQGAFNRPTISDILAAAIWSGEGVQEIAGAAVWGVRLAMDGNSNLVISGSRVTEFKINPMDGNSNAIFQIGKSLVFNADWSGEGVLQVNNDSFQIYLMKFNGTLTPGQRITLNTEKFTLKRDGVDILPSFEGNFIDLKPGNNEIVIESDTTTRTLIIRVEHKDRWV